jgi:phenylalanyl-tRNA synthetase beta chain
MKVPCRWLAEYVEIDLTEDAIHRLAERLTLAGVEVEGIVRIGALRNAVVGRVLSCDPLPDSDHLQLCEVDLGDHSAQIVCGAPNAAAGMVVPVVTPGGVLPGGLTIDRRTLRGQVSEGMICSKEELGLEERSEGIWPLSEALGLAPGTPLDEQLEHDDFILDIKVPSNRPDCASVYGIAREVAALLNRPLARLDTRVNETLPETATILQVEIEDERDTPRYCAKVCAGVKIGPSPLRLQHRLIKAGMRPLSNVIDITNYVMLELGHPLHPFDADRLNGPIHIRRATAGEPFRTLDGVNRHLSPEALLITDRDGGIALAGVMGGERSEITETTSRILLEIASFFGHRIRLSARSVGLRSEASQRFERGLNPASIPFVAQRASHLLQQITGCRVNRGLAEAYPAPAKPRSIILRPQRAAELLGLSVDTADCTELLDRLQLPTSVENGALRVEVPDHRVDLEREVDLIEEIGRVYGYDRWIAQPPRPVLRVGRKDRTERVKDHVRDALVGLGLSEIITDGFDNRPWRELIGGSDEDLVQISNPMTRDQAALRDSLIPDLLNVVETNLRQGVDGGMLFEWSRTFSTADGERETLGGVLFGRTGRPLRGKEMVSLPLAKGLLDALFLHLQLEPVDTITDVETPAFLHPFRSVWFAHNGQRIGFLGALDPALSDQFALRVPIVLFEFSASCLIDQAEQANRYRKVSTFPTSKRDLSVSAPRDLPEATVRKQLLKEPAIQSALLYDLYQGDPIPPDQKSLTYELTFRAVDHTLTDAEVASAVQRTAEKLASLGVHVRDR